MKKIIKNLNTFLKEGNVRSIKAKKNILLSFAASVLAIAISFIFVPLLLEYLDAERYGIWLTMTSIVGWFTFFDGGLGKGLKNNLVIALSKDNKILAREYISTTYAILSGVFFILLVVLYSINPILEWKKILNVKSISERELSLLALVVFTFFFLRFILKIIEVVSDAKQEPAINKFFAPIASVLSLIAILILIKTTQSNLVLLGFILSFTPVLVLCIATIILFGIRYKDLKPSYRLVKIKHVRELSVLGGKFFFIQISRLVLFSLSSFLIIQYLGPEEVAQYNIALKYFQAPVMVYGIVMTPIWAATTDAYVKGDMHWLKNVLRKLNILSVLFVLGIILMYFIGDWVYRIWLNDAIEIPTVLNISMMFYAIVTVILSPYSQFINGFGKLVLSIRITIFKIALFIPIAILFLKSPLGVAGVMVTTVLFSILSSPFYIIQVNKIINNKAEGTWFK
ncbi:Na+-driven multidrug efflux pump [Mesonia algae]|uniref:Na+-driven multidrug efflux pump n=1 Tax=Mesonia algae TaxID=213248 RepID=A0A2W7IA59_9FLAO|nr:oligosaccharide flippase family protein [Mesonia algae]PZW43786.1 Na+-driven multidrug efflux pump [Mesonia algae]